jgi:hypothetical protein
MSASSWDERQSLLKRQARFKAKQPHYGDKYKRLFPKPKLWCPMGKEAGLGAYRVFALGDPRDIDVFPHVVGIMPTKVHPVWQRFWDLKDVSKAEWASWMRRLTEDGVEPVDILAWRVGVPVGLSSTLAYKICKFRLKGLRATVAGNKLPWLIPDLYRELRVRNIRYLENGVIHKPASFRRVDALILHTDFKGRTWFDN